MTSLVVFDNATTNSTSKSFKAADEEGDYAFYIQINGTFDGAIVTPWMTLNLDAVEKIAIPGVSYNTEYVGRLDAPKNATIDFRITGAGASTDLTVYVCTKGG